MTDTEIIQELEKLAEEVRSNQYKIESSLEELSRAHQDITSRGLVGADTGNAASDACNSLCSAEDNLRMVSQTLAKYGQDTETAIDILNNK